MEKELVMQKIVPILQKLTDEEEIHPDDELLDDLGISSMDILMLMTILEEEFHTSVSESQLRRIVTVEDMADMITDTLDR